MKITIIYDNQAWDKNLEPDWGFACLVEAYGKSILFDTGAKDYILHENIKKLKIDPLGIDEIFISHYHWDHTGGLSSFIKLNPVKVYIPHSIKIKKPDKNIISVKKQFKIHENIFSTGELKDIEQSLVIKQDNDVIVITGCSHPGVAEILRAASEFGRVKALVGGLHGFNDFGLIDNLETICPVHCTQHIEEIKNLYPEKYIEGGAGKVINL